MPHAGDLVKVEIQNGAVHVGLQEGFDQSVEEGKLNGARHEAHE